MDTGSARSTSLSSTSAYSSPAPSVISETALEAEIKAKIDEIEWQRDEESAAMSNRLYNIVMEYKRRDQGFVDRHTKYLDRLSRHLPAVAKTRPWATPCRGVVEREAFLQGGLAIKFHPSPLTSLPPPQGNTIERETVTTWKLASTTAAVVTEPTTHLKHPEISSLSSSSPLSIVGSPSQPTPKLLLAPSTPEAQLPKHSKRPPSPDELTLDSSALSPTAAGQDTKISQIPERGPRRKRTKTYRRRKQPTQAKQPTQSKQFKQSTHSPSTPPQKPSSVSPSTPAQRPSSAISPISHPISKPGRGPPCLECRKRKVRCSRSEPPCSRCKEDGKPCEY